jgi:hypothetical protein
VPFRSLDPRWVKNQDPHPGSYCRELKKQFIRLK